MNEPLEVPKLAKAPDWDEPFQPTKLYGELAGNITELSRQIEQAAEQLRQNLPKSGRNLVPIEQSSGFLDITIRGGVYRHSDIAMWVTTTTLNPVMRVICSARNLKPQIEDLLSSQRARKL